ncbi:MAG: hypothetical protein GY851_00165, partial [bacterium]|nr:hypothetical protein [bacterium]
MGTRTLFIKTLGIGVAIVMFACASAYADDGILTWPVETKGQEVALGFEVTGTVAAESGDGGQVVELTGFASGGAPGSPMLPTKTLSFLVPPDADPDTVAAVLEDASWELVPGSFDLAPAPPAATLGDSGPVVAWGDVDPANIRDGRNTELYATDALFPASALGTPAPSMYREWRLVHVDLTPVACNPVTGEVKLLRTGTIRVSYQLGAESSAVKLASGEAKDVGTFWQQVSTTLVNPDDAGSFYPVSATKVGSNSGAGTGMVIITTNNIVTNSTKLASFRTHKATMLSTTVDIITEAASGDASHYTTGASCSQRAANIRSWLKLFYSGWGIQHVLLIGDPHPSTFSSTTSIPMMMCYPQANTTSNSTPTDMCFAELSGNWNVDADSYPGEWGSSTEDFATGGIDFNCEVKV